MSRYPSRAGVGTGLGIFLLIGVLAVHAADLEERVRRLEERAETRQTTIPDWVQRFTLSGDFRLRYEFENETGSPERHRGRFRYRLSLDAAVIEGLQVGFGIASGGDDPRSANQTFQDTFSSKSIRIDLAFATYTPVEGLKVTGGKMKNPLWTPSDLLWDTDIRPEGGVIALERDLREAIQLFLTAGIFVLDELGEGAEPLLMPIQVGLQVRFARPVALQIAVTYYEFIETQGKLLDFSAGTNTLSGGGLAFDYDAVSLSLEWRLSQLFGNAVPYIGLLGEYVRSFDPDDDHTGFLVGMAFGHERVQQAGHWQVTYRYRRLERDAWPDVFPNSSFLNGETHARGHDIAVVYGILKQVDVGLHYYHSQAIAGGREEDLFQLDVRFRF